MYEKLVEAIVKMDEEEAMTAAKALLDNGDDPLKILEQCRKAGEIVGAQFEKAEYFLPEFMMAGHMLGEISNLVKPGDKEQEARPGRRKRPYSKLCRLDQSKHGDSRPEYGAHEITAIHTIPLRCDVKHA